MNCKNLHSLSALRVKALFGVPSTLLAELLFVVLPELERRRTARLESRSDRKRKLVANDGRPRTVKAGKGVRLEYVNEHNRERLEGVRPLGSSCFLARCYILHSQALA